MLSALSAEPRLHQLLNYNQAVLSKQSSDVNVQGLGSSSVGSIVSQVTYIEQLQETRDDTIMI